MKPLIIALLLALTCSAKAESVVDPFYTSDTVRFEWNWKTSAIAQIEDEWKRGEISYRKCLDERLRIQSSTLDSVVWHYNNVWTEYGSPELKRERLHAKSSIKAHWQKGPLWLRLFWSAYCWLQ